MESAVRKRRISFLQNNRHADKRTRNLSTIPPPSTLVQTVKKPVKKFSSDLANLPPVPAIDAFQRGYRVESILDMVQNTHKEQFLYIKFTRLIEPELVPLELALQHVPHLLSDFYKEYVQAWQKMEQQE
ncbi:uncharacterized protein LOC6611372 [Drosophila sechellia]|uniref:GM16095 n=1 Tax=Drosophila sechellia TaxID=7238 RepID=B4HXR0_DROSE|nr:uncharacterized protein LOC6611372 [Drosophila sechellia]EDW51840.1 GM16095 [Drosophila sechellia]